VLDLSYDNDQDFPIEPSPGDANAASTRVGSNVRLCEGLQTPAVTNIPPPTWPASGNLEGTKAREGTRIRPCHARSYGDLPGTSAEGCDPCSKEKWPR
jgi:hypothetical protein